jgi:pimeloyl-ACP methyl ester carboxylesterase
VPAYAHDTTPTQYLETGGIRFAYRRFGDAYGGRVPLVFFQHFRGNMDTFDPAITDAFAADREVVLFDNAGVGQSSGQARDTIEGLAADAGSFLDALGLDRIDLLGHSMGGEWAQLVALGRPSLVRRLVLVGTGPRGGEGMSAQRPSTAELFAREYERQDEMWLPIFFSPSRHSQDAGRRYLTRIRARPQDRDTPVSAETARAHRVAAGGWGQPARDGYAYLEKITQPVLVVNGSTDIVIATGNSFTLQQHLPNAQLIVYPDSGHGAHFQYPELFVAQTRLFLDS